eukprot:9498421-Pyramimonas_sp.AAC.1
MEKSGWQLPTGFATIRGWIKLVAIFSGSSQDVAIKMWASASRAKAENTRNSLPHWQAGFEGGRIIEKVVFKLLVGKLAVISKHHVALVNLLRDINQAAQMLNITPRPQIHEETSEPIALAVSVLNDARLASVVVLGIDLVSKFRAGAIGQKEASSFLDMYPQAKYTAVPDG